MSINEKIKSTIIQFNILLHNSNDIKQSYQWLERQQKRLEDEYNMDLSYSFLYPEMCNIIKIDNNETIDDVESYIQSKSIYKIKPSMIIMNFTDNPIVEQVSDYCNKNDVYLALMTK